jgi:curved DNA-binding protein CbpA
LASASETDPSVESEATPSVEIPGELQAEIRGFARGLLSMSYYEVLGVAPDVEEAAIREAFFERSKRFHPDRYFSKRMGPYQDLLTEIYKRIVVAHEVLRDPRLRSDYDKRLEASRRAAAAGPSLRARGGLRSANAVLRRLEQQVEIGRQKARHHFQEALLHKQRGDSLRAVDLVRLAMAFDPREQSYHDALADLLPNANAERTAELRRKAEVLLARSEADAALPFLEDAAKLQPTDAELAAQVALLSLEVGDLEKALEFAERAVSLDDDNPRFRLTLGRVYRAAKRPSEARKEFQRAWKLDPLDEEVKAELARP